VIIKLVQKHKKNAAVSTPQTDQDVTQCPHCTKDAKDGTPCDLCGMWFHMACETLSVNYNAATAYSTCAACTAQHLFNQSSQSRSSNRNEMHADLRCKDLHKGFNPQLKDSYMPSIMLDQAQEETWRKTLYIFERLHKFKV
jgi:hypothetical protein